MIEKKSSPDLELWIIAISKSYIWVNPLDIDSLITDKIEKKIKDIDWIKEITSTSSLWFSSVVVELDNWINIQDTMTEIKDEIDTIDFPVDANDTVVQDISSNDNTLFSVALYSEESEYSKDYLLNKAIVLKDKLEWTSWINKIEIDWWSDYEIKILVDKAKLEELWLTINSVANTISDHNKNTPIWNYNIWDLNYDFRFQWEITNINEILEIPVLLQNWNVVHIKDFASIKKHFKNDSISKFWSNTKKWLDSITLVIQKADNDDLFKASVIAKERLAKEITWITYEWIKYEIFTDVSEVMMQSYEDLFSSMLTTFILVFITLLIFIWFKEWFIWILIIPLSYCITFIILYYWWFSLNFLTNFSLILSLWVAIDTIIVVIEWSNKKVKLGYAPKHAILVAIREYAPPIISWTATTLAAFIPLLTLPWVMWKYLSYIPITVFITLLASLFLSLTVTSAIFMKLTKNPDYYRINKKEEDVISDNEKALLQYDRENKTERKWKRVNIREKMFDWLSDIYYNILSKIIKSKALRLVLILLPIFLLLVSFSFWNWLKIFPESDNTSITAKIEAKEWKDTESLTYLLPILDDKIKNIPEIKLYTSNLNDNTLSIAVELLSKDDRDEMWLRDSFKVEAEISNRLDYFKQKWFSVESWMAEGWPPGWKAVWIKIVAESTEFLSTLSNVTDDFSSYLKSLEWTKNISTSTSKTPWQFVFKLDYEKISNLWLTPWEITWSIFANTNWIQAWTIKWILTDYDIKVKIADFEENLSPYEIENLVLNTSKWKIRLSEIASYEFETAISEIKRIDTEITTLVDSDLVDWIVQSEVQPLIIDFAENYDFPVWISYKAWGEAEENADLIQSTVTSFIITLFLIFIILVLQFNSYWQPAIILYSVIASMLWVNIGLYFMWIPYSMPFAIWFIALTWIVINNAIIYVDKINKNLKEWLEGEDSILQAWKSRLVPMLVTTITTVFGIYPIAIQDQFWAGLWFTIIFGLVTGTIMTLFVIPALYYQASIQKRGLLDLFIYFILTIGIFVFYSFMSALIFS